jgi:hypothetical protein
LIFHRNSLKNLGTLEFDEIWLKSSCLHLVAWKINKFLAKEDQKIEFPLKNGIWIDFAIV